MAARSKHIEPRYAVNVQMKARDIEKAGGAITLKVKDRDNLVGAIGIGQGTFGWKGAHGKRDFKRIPWIEFAAIPDDVYGRCPRHPRQIR